MARQVCRRTISAEAARAARAAAAMTRTTPSEYASRVIIEAARRDIDLAARELVRKGELPAAVRGGP
jgi:hypothetical protein